MKLPYLYNKTTKCVVVFLFSWFGCVLTQTSSSNEEAVPHKVGIIESVAKVSALLLPAKVSEINKVESDAVTYGTIAGFPRCPSTCSASWLGDDWCDSECASDECGNDGGDCEGWCAGDCKPGWIGDGYCDIDCFREECKWDGDDCAKNYTKTQLQHPLPKHQNFDYSKCPISCINDFLHDGECDEECNTVECNFDGEDCYHQCAPYCANAWLGDGDCDPDCNVAACGFDKGDCKVCSPGCNPEMLGNGVCDIACDNHDCDSDVGDCYGVCWVAEKIDYQTEPFFYPHCRTEWKGDGYCDCFCMNEACNFDHGDCEKTDCSIEFALLKEMNKKMNSTVFPFPNPNQSVLSSLITEMTK